MSSKRKLERRRKTGARSQRKRPGRLAPGERLRTPAQRRTVPDVVHCKTMAACGEAVCQLADDGYVAFYVRAYSDAPGGFVIAGHDDESVTLAVRELGKEMDRLAQEDEVQEAVDDLLARGLLEENGVNEAGETIYRTTQKGRAEIGEIGRGSFLDPAALINMPSSFAFDALFEREAERRERAIKYPEGGGLRPVMEELYAAGLLLSPTEDEQEEIVEFTEYCLALSTGEDMTCEPPPEESWGSFDPDRYLEACEREDQLAMKREQQIGVAAILGCEPAELVWVDSVLGFQNVYRVREGKEEEVARTLVRATE